MTNLEKLNQSCGGNESSAEMALEIMLQDIENDYDIVMSDAYKHVIVSAFFAKKAWLESEVEE